MSKSLHPAIILGGGSSANGLGIARNLGSRGIPVYSVTSDSHELSRFSKYCKRAMIVPDVESDPIILFKALQNLQFQLSATGVLFPTTDTMMLTVAQIREELEHYVMNISSSDVIQTMVDKTRFYRSLRVSGIPHPWTLLPDEINMKTVEKQVSFPVFLRPAQSQPFNKRFRKKGFVAQNLHELRTLLRYIQRNKLEMMVQDIIPGPTTNGYVLRGYFDKKSHPIVLVATQKIRQPHIFSNNCVKISVPVAQIAEGVKGTIQYLKDLHYRGIFGAEFKQDPRDCEFKLLEINARSMGGNMFPSVLGVNHILTAYHDVLGESVTPITNYDCGVYGINLIIDTATLMKRILTGGVKSYDLLPYIRKKHWSRFSFDDPLPFFKTIHTLIIKKLSN